MPTPLSTSPRATAVSLSIQLDDVSFSYRLGMDLSIKGAVLDMLRPRGRARRPRPTVEAVRGISLEVRQGETLGIIGRNGAGKSTLLKLMGGLIKPTTGHVAIAGKPTCLFEVAAGFEPTSTGWDNITLRSLLLGARPRQIKAKAAEIAEFSELGEFLDLPVRCYSAGMYVRLGFAISTAYDAEILLVDEAIGAGDAVFAEKARARMRALIGRAGVLGLVSHSLESIAELCERVVWLEGGQLRADGPPAEVVPAYQAFCQEMATQTAALPGGLEPADPNTATS